MPFFLKPCIKLRKKKKKTVKNNSSMYFKPYLDKESPVTSEAIHEGASNSFVSIDRDEKDVGLPPKLILGSSESQTENTEAKESGNIEDITGVPSPDRDIFDILSSAVQQLSEEKSSSDDNRYSILSSSSRLDEETDNTEMKELLNESFDTSDNKLNDAKEQQLPDSFKEECVEDLIEDESETQDFIIAKRLSKNMPLTEIYREEHESRAEAIKMIPVEEFSVDVVEFVSIHHQISEIEPLVPLTIQECCVERTAASVRNESAEISEYKCEEEACVEFENASTIDPSTINLIPSPEKIHWESESDISLQEVSPIIDISDQQEEIFEPESNQFFDSELSLAVQNALCVSFCESDHENTTGGCTDDVTKEYFDNSSCLEITAASVHLEEEMIIPSESINLSFGDNIPELLKIEGNKTENVPFNDTVFNETTLETSKMIHKLGSPILSECSGDHPANITNTYEKGLSCRMAANLMNDLPSDFPTNQMNADRQTKSNTEQRNTVNKRRRSRNVLLNSLKIKLSPEDLKKETNNTDQHGSDERSEHKCTNNSNEKNNPCDDNALQTLEQNYDKIEKEDIVGHAFIYEIKPFKTLGNYTDERSDVTFETRIGNLDKKNVSSFIESTVKNKLSNEKFENSEEGNTTENLENYSITRINDSLSIEKASNPFDTTEEMQMRVHQVIKKILGFVQREVSLLLQNMEYEPKGFSYFINELLFDYSFYQEQKNEKLLNNQKDSDGNTVEANETKSADGQDKDLCTCKFDDTEIEINENYELSPNKYNISFEDMESFNISFESTKCENETFMMDFENSRGVEINEKEDEDRMLITTEIRSNDDEIFDDLKLSQSLDEYLALAEHLKCKNKTQKSKNTLTPINNDMESKNTPDDFNSKTLHTTSENIISFQMTSDYPAIVGSLNNLKSFSFDNINLLDDAEKDKILESPNFSSEGGDIGKNDLCMETFTSCGDTCIKLNLSEENIKSETIVTSDSTTEAHVSELNAEKCTLSGQDPQNHLTIVLSPRENNATVNCSVNMTISGNTPTCTTRLTSPISIQVTRDDTRRRETCSFRTRDSGSSTSPEDIMETCRLHRTHKFDVKKLERERLRNLELYDLNKREAMKPMRKQTRIVPIHPAESFEFTLSNLDDSVKATKRSAKHSAKSTKHDIHKLLTPYQIKCKGAKSDGNDFNRYPSSDISPVQELDIGEERIPTNQTFHRRYDSPNSPVYGTPMRRRILTASKAIRSPKYSLKAEPSPSKEIRCHKATAHKINVNKPKLYFLDESSPEYKRQHKGRSRALENTTHFEDRQRPLNSPFSDYRQHYLCTKLNSPTDLNSKFDDKFKRYARRGRNTGDLISYKRSTQWLRDAGIVGQVLTAEEADRAFKSAAGVKVALNKFDYRRFLYKLTRLKKLRYREIYERLCEAVNELA
ncbi:hypothetical protein AVEN_19790-1 [Araneus ventricosus]|uniref:Uncharacterized protein n=1 Tax=Araneus ventricosus TaxID=182803 RepID=A0A4Y2HBY5_ARAVE|nr:hypothetical protein AVEN_19790-1 [Araneus ventricosus]